MMAVAKLPAPMDTRSGTEYGQNIVPRIKDGMICRLSIAKRGNRVAGKFHKEANTTLVQIWTLWLFPVHVYLLLEYCLVSVLLDTDINFLK